LADFTLTAPLATVLSALLTSSHPSDLPSLLASLLKPDSLLDELVADYPNFLLYSLPLEYFDVNFLLKYLMPRDSLLAKHFKDLDSLNWLWEEVCILLLEEAGQPGKAA